MMTPLLADMYAHMRWADRRTLAMLREAEGAVAEAWKLYCHILAAERIWIDRISGRSIRPEPWPVLSVEDCETLISSNAADFSAILEEGASPGLDAVVEYSNLSGTLFRTRLSDILAHVALHGAYHRGQVAKLLRQAGHSVVPTDYIVYSREKKPL